MAARDVVRYTMGAFLVATATLGFVWFGSTVYSARAEPATAPATDGLVFRVPVTGTIEMGLAPFVARSIQEAREAQATAIIIEIETPGGRVDAAERIVDAVKDAGIPVYAYVNRRAFSAGAMIALATDEIYMRDGAMLGAVEPVGPDGVRAPEKIVSAIRAEMRALAEARGLDPRIAEAMVDGDVVIEGVIEAGKLLTLSTELAVLYGYATEVADWDELVALLELQNAAVHQTTINWAESIVRFLTHPVVAPMLLSLGFLGLLIEIKTPSFGIAGGAGISSLALFFGSHYIVGLAGLEHVMLLLAGVALLAAELFIIPGFGIAGILGVLAILASAYMSLLMPFGTLGDHVQAAGLLSVSLIVVVLAAWALFRQLPTSRRFASSGLMLGEVGSRVTGYLSQPDRPELVGMTGVTLTDLRPAGTARFGDERLDVVAPTWVGAGTVVRIIRSEGYRYVVEPVEADAG